MSDGMEQGASVRDLGCVCFQPLQVHSKSQSSSSSVSLSQRYLQRRSGWFIIQNITSKNVVCSHTGSSQTITLLLTNKCLQVVRGVHFCRSLVTNSGCNSSFWMSGDPMSTILTGVIPTIFSAMISHPANAILDSKHRGHVKLIPGRSSK